MGFEPLHLLIDIAWVAGHSVGAAAIDADHQRLFRMLDHMRRHYAAGEEGRCRTLIQQFALAIQAHFRREEALFADLAYPGAGRHVAQHAVLAHRAASIADASGRISMGRRTLADLIDGLAVVMMTDHLALDLEVSRYLTDGPAPTAPKPRS